MSKNTDIRQIPLTFAPQPFLGKEDFMVSSCNAEAFSYVESWPDWPFFAVCLYGPAGCGKSHLANMFSDNVSVKTHYPYKIPHVRASEVTAETLRLFEQHPCLIVEDLTETIDNEAMFHLYNQYRNENGYILFTSETAPARLHLNLPDLRSRLNIVPAVEIREPDDELLQALIVKLFNDRQIIISQEVLNYILANTQRSYAFVRRLVAETDNISLALKRAVTIPIVKEALAVLNDDHQGKLF